MSFLRVYVVLLLFGVVQMGRVKSDTTKLLSSNIASPLAHANNDHIDKSTTANEKSTTPSSLQQVAACNRSKTASVRKNSITPCNAVHANQKYRLRRTSVIVSYTENNLTNDNIVVNVDIQDSRSCDKNKPSENDEPTFDVKPQQNSSENKTTLNTAQPNSGSPDISVLQGQSDEDLKFQNTPDLIDQNLSETLDKKKRGVPTESNSTPRTPETPTPTEPNSTPRTPETPAPTEPNSTPRTPETPAPTEPNSTPRTPETPAPTEPNSTPRTPETPTPTEPNSTPRTPETPAPTEPNSTPRTPETPTPTKPIPVTPILATPPPQETTPVPNDTTPSVNKPVSNITDGKSASIDEPEIKPVTNTTTPVTGFKETSIVAIKRDVEPSTTGPSVAESTKSLVGDNIIISTSAPATSASETESREKNTTAGTASLPGSDEKNATKATTTDNNTGNNPPQVEENKAKNLADTDYLPQDEPFQASKTNSGVVITIATAATVLIAIGYFFIRNAVAPKETPDLSASQISNSAPENPDSISREAQQPIPNDMYSS